MCGIAGIATTDGLRPTDAELHDTMLRCLAHRGPDDQWQAGDELATIGARRLSIIDLDTGRQPIANEDGSIWATQNGEIYNYVELRDELAARGHKLVTAGDTEVIVHLYEDHGPDFVRHLRGMFAIALWDAPRRRLVLARDRLGKKPLYWRLADGRLTYGSELKALMADPSLERRVDPRALEAFFAYQYVPSPASILQGVHKLPPASVLVWEAGSEPVISRYWELMYEPKERMAAADQRAETLRLLRESVRLRMRSDVPVGLFLSGGMDSSVVLALMAELSSKPVRTFTIGFDDPHLNEAGYARVVADRYGADHTEEIVTLDAIQLLPRLAEHYDEPFGDSSAIPTFRVSELAAREVKVVLNGDGGDETFGGYERYRIMLGFHTLDWLPASVRRSAARVGLRTALRNRPGAWERAERWVSSATQDDADRYLSMMSIMDTAQRRALLGATDGASEYLRQIMWRNEASGLDRVLRADVLAYLPEDLLVKMDRATMANSLEARAPMLDHVLMEFVARLPTDRKVRLRRTKVLLREIATDLLGRAIVERPKMGFGVPLAGWFERDLGDRFTELVLAPDARSRDVLDVGEAEELLRRLRAGERRLAHQLWLIMMYELWARRWLPAAS